MNSPERKQSPIRWLPRRATEALRSRNFAVLSRFVLTLVGLIALYSLLFHGVMAYEDRSYSWLTGFYWTLTTMSTLGYGDIVFHSDLGRLFSVVVLFSGIILMLVLLPFTFIQFVFEPWRAARAASLVPRRVREGVTGHVILTFYGPVAAALIRRLEQFHYPYVVVLPEREEVERLQEKGVAVMFGDLDNPATYQRANVTEAAMVATTRTDIVNTNVVFTVRHLCPDLPVVATVRDPAAAEVLTLAGCSRVLDLTQLMATALARRAIGGKKFTHVVGRIDDLLLAEVDAARTTLVGETLGQAQERTAVSVVGVWSRGHFETGDEDYVIEDTTTLVMAGTPAQLKEFDATCRLDGGDQAATAPVVVIGGGRVGRATAQALELRGIEYRIVEILPERTKDDGTYVLGSGADREVMIRAGIEQAPTVIITTGDDEVNVYLTIFCRLLRPDIQIVCRATLERNLAVLHRAGADMVMSYASMGSSALFNLLKRSDLLMIAEGLDVFKVPVPASLAGKTLLETNLRRKTGCSVIGIDPGDGTRTDPHSYSVLPEGGEIILIGSPEVEAEFLELYAN